MTETMKNLIKDIFTKENWRAFKKIPKALYVFAGAALSTGFLSVKNKIAGEKRSTVLRDHFIKAAAKVMDTKIEYSPNSVPVTDKVAIFPMKHLGRMDARMVPEFPQADFMMTAHFFNMPVLGPLIKAGADASGFIATTQTKENKGKDLGNVIQRLNSGVSISLFPAGVCTGVEMCEWSKGSLEPLFGAAGQDLNGKDVFLERDVVVQPVALQVKEINGENVLDQPEKWSKYTMIFDKSPMVPTRIWRRMQLESVTLQATVLPEMLASDFNSAADMMNEARRQVLEIVNPNQQGMRKRREFLEWLDQQPHQVA